MFVADFTSAPEAELYTFWGKICYFKKEARHDAF